MNFKWLQNKLTFVIIPEANGRVVRINLSRAVIWGSALFLTVLTLTSAAVYLRGMHSAASTYMRTTELHGKTAQLEQDLQGKNATIEELHQEIHSLSQQAEAVKNKMEEMQQLEAELKKLAPGRSSGGSKASAAAAVPASPEAPLVAEGMGGPSLPATSEGMRKLASSTGARYAELHQEMDRLQSRFAESKQQLQQRQERILRTPSIWPTVSKLVTSVYGYRKDPFTKKLSFHRGIDIAGKLDDPVFAAASGTVYSVGYDKLHGHNVVLEHSEGLRTWYMHLNSTSVHKGDTIDKGQAIGRLGTTGRSTGPHLHYEVMLSGKSTDPAPYMPAYNRKEKKGS